MVLIALATENCKLNIEYCVGIQHTKDKLCWLQESGALLDSYNPVLST